VLFIMLVVLCSIYRLELFLEILCVVHHVGGVV
jgi:hypothetical protein